MDGHQYAVDWEGRGVQPDVPCEAEEALDRALELARVRLGEQDAV